MAKVNPKLNLQVENTLAGDGNTMAVDLDFRKMDDFTPEAIVEQVEPLKQLLDARNKLRDLLSKADRSEELETVLEQILKNTDNITEISQQLGVGESKEGAE